MSASATLAEDTVDDILYFSRAGDADSLQTTLDQTSKELGSPPHDVLAAAIDAASGNSALHMAAANGHTEIVKLLLSLTPVPATAPISIPSPAPSAIINLPNGSGNTPLHWAAMNGHIESVKTLMQAGASVAIKNGAGHTAAFEAEQAGKEDVASWLLEAGADIEDTNVEEEEVAELTDDLVNGAAGDDDSLDGGHMDVGKNT